MEGAFDVLVSLLPGGVGGEGGILISPFKLKGGIFSLTWGDTARPCRNADALSSPRQCLRSEWRSDGSMGDFWSTPALD